MDKTPLQVIGERLEALQANAAEIAQRAENDPTKENVEEMKALLHGSDESPGIIAEIADLTARRDEELRKEEMKAMQGAIGDLQSVINELRKPAGGEFTLGGADAAEGKAFAEDDPYRPGQGHSWTFASPTRATPPQGAPDQGLRGPERRGQGNDGGHHAQGGYLVRPQVERQIVQARELDNVLRGLCSKLNVTTNSIQLDQLGLSTIAGWVAELAQKPESTGMTLATVTASVFTAAGLATISNQLLADSNPAVDGLVTPTSPSASSRWRRQRSSTAPAPASRSAS
jgi:HK97 family phage major capsid protein